MPIPADARTKSLTCKDIRTVREEDGRIGVELLCNCNDCPYTHIVRFIVGTKECPMFDDPDVVVDSTRWTEDWRQLMAITRVLGLNGVNQLKDKELNGFYLPLEKYGKFYVYQFQGVE
jgi:hypothetical protein